jgi:hypothetical protein
LQFHLAARGYLMRKPVDNYVDRITGSGCQIRSVYLPATHGFILYKL